MKAIAYTIRYTILAIFFASCVNSEADKNANEPFTKGSWQIISFTIDNEQQLDAYKSYRFLFDSDGSVAAADATNFATGIYKVLSTESTDDMPASDISFVMDFRDAKLATLNGSWLIREKTNKIFSMQQTKGEMVQVLVLRNYKSQ